MTELLRFSSMGDGVGAVQQALVEAGYEIEPGELAAQRFGMSTTVAVRDFQARHVGPDGHALTDDGIVGPATLWAFEHPGGGGGALIVPGWRCSPSDAPAGIVEVMRLAVAELAAGVREDPPGSNRGPRVDVYTAPNLGIAWCAAFVSYCYRACDGGSPFGRRFSAESLRAWATARGRIVEPGASLRPGDLFVTIRASGHGHTGLVASILDDDRFYTVEGNSGNAVRGLLRRRSGIGAILRPYPTAT